MRPLLHPCNQGISHIGIDGIIPQYCQLPNLTTDQHFCALTDKLAYETAMANMTPTGRHLIKLLQSRIKQIVEPTPEPMEQEAQEQEQRLRLQQQMVIDKTPILTVPRITNAPPMRVLKNMLHLHQRQTRSNTPGTVPAIQQVNVIEPHTRTPSVVGQKRVEWQDETQKVRRHSKRIQDLTTPTPYIPIPGGVLQRIVTRQAINVLTIQEGATVG
jgi:hypothetical protein